MVMGWRSDATLQTQRSCTTLRRFAELECVRPPRRPSRPASLRLVVGTAGHVDHGKTALVRALTGVDTDRLPVERERGITTELGFAKLDLPVGAAAFIDVPGHERFIHAMVSGAAGLDAALLVIATDEGVMPQTREHLDICRILGVRAGLTVLTKDDLAPAMGMARMDELRAEVARLVEGTPFAARPPLPVSVRTGEGLDALRAALGTLVAELPPRSSEGPLWLGIDRVFSVRGAGTVVTGTVASGEVRREDAVVILPAGKRGELRVPGRAGARVAGRRGPCGRARRAEPAWGRKWMTSRAAWSWRVRGSSPGS